MNTLSKREAEVVEHVIEGLSNRNIAKNLGVCEKTIKFHLTNIFKKTGLKSRALLTAAHYKGALKNAPEADQAVPC